MTKEFKGQNGAKIVINIARFEESARLRNAVGKELLKQNIDINDQASLAKADEELSSSGSNLLMTMAKILISCDISEEFNTALFVCLKYCTYNNIQIKPDLFDDVPEAREDYFPIVFECIQENVYPFIKGLLSKLKTLKVINALSQQSNAL